MKKTRRILPRRLDRRIFRAKSRPARPLTSVPRGGIRL